MQNQRGTIQTHRNNIGNHKKTIRSGEGRQSNPSKNIAKPQENQTVRKPEENRSVAMADDSNQLKAKRNHKKNKYRARADNQNKPQNIAQTKHQFETVGNHKTTGSVEA